MKLSSKFTTEITIRFNKNFLKSLSVSASSLKDVRYEVEKYLKNNNFNKSIYEISVWSENGFYKNFNMKYC